MQSRRFSFIEACVNTAIGFVVSMILWHWVCKWYDIPMPLKTNLEITSIFTVVSILRGYVVRRFFNLRRFLK